MTAVCAFLFKRANRTENLFIKLLFLMLLPSLIFANSAASDNQNKKILIIHSYHQGLVWTDDIMEGIYSVFNKDDSDIDMSIEYMDTKRHFDGFDGKYMNSLLDFYRNKYKSIKFDVIISSDDNALRFLLMHHRELFPETPIIFCGVNDFKDEMLSGHDEITGVLEFLDQKSSLDIALKLHPGTDKVFIITDISTTGNANRLILQKIAEGYSDRAEFIFLDKDNSGLSLQELLERLEGLPEKSIVYYSDFLRNREGYVDQETAVPMITRHSKRPVYTHYDEILGLGVAGGKLVNGRSHGRMAAEIAMKVMDGLPASEIPVYKESINRYMFDYSQLKRFEINESWLPDGSIVVNRPDAFYSQHKRTVWTAVAVIGGLLVLIIYLNINIARRKEAEKRLQETNIELERRVEERTMKLLESEEKYRILVDTAPYGIQIADRDGVIVYSNRAHHEILGFNEGEIVGKKCAWDFIASESRRSETRQYYKNLMEEQPEPEVIYNKNITRDDKLIDARIDWNYMRDRSGKVTGTYAIISDITESRQAEERIRESEARFRSVFEQSMDGIMIADLESKSQIEANKTICDMLGYGRDELLSLRVEDLHPKEELPRIMDLFEKQARGEISLVSDIPMLRKDGTVIYVEVNASRVPLNGRQCIVGNFRNITERRKADEELKEREMQLAESQRIAHIGSWQHNLTTNKVIWSDELFRLLGMDPEKDPADFNKFFSMIHPEDQSLLKNAITETLETGKHFSVEYRFILDDGRTRILHAQAELIHDETGTQDILSGTGQDITERKEVEDRINSALKEKELLLKEIHHRVKNNMAIVSSLLNLQSRYVKDIKLNRILSESRNRITSMALVHEKLYQTKDFMNVNFKDYVEDLARYLLQTYKKNEDDIMLNLSVDDLYFYIDTIIPFGLVLNELVTNSLKYAFEGVKKPEISISFNEYDDYISMIYSDNGIGLPEHIDIANSQTLGLQIINMLMLQLQGTVELDSEKRRVFTLKLSNPKNIQ